MTYRPETAAASAASWLALKPSSPGKNPIGWITDEEGLAGVIFANLDSGEPELEHIYGGGFARLFPTTSELLEFYNLSSTDVASLDTFLGWGVEEMREKDGTNDGLVVQALYLQGAHRYWGLLGET